MLTLVAQIIAIAMLLLIAVWLAAGLARLLRRR